MIAVIADDLTGAAEIAGLGWRHGLRAVILHRDAPPARADLVVYDADSRLCSARAAARRVGRIARRLRAAQPEWIYKKVDSVLRGNVLAEIAALRRVLRSESCLLVPANPSAGRILRAGKYFIGDQPLHRTDFRRDPTHPRRSADVLKLLGAARDGGVRVLPAPDGTRIEERDLSAVVVGEAASPGDVRAWAKQAGAGTLLAGGGEFFAALLERRVGGRGASRTVVAPGRARMPGRVASARLWPSTSLLLVSGSRSESSRDFLAAASRRGWAVSFMPEKLFASGRPNEPLRLAWAREVRAALRRQPRVAMAIGGPARPGQAARLGERLVAAVRLVLAANRPDFVCVEGGATGALLWERLGGRRLFVEGEWATGVVVVRLPGVRGLRLVLKPGSYAWPAALLAGGAGRVGSGHPTLTV